jgi:hypothetical protein
MGSEIVDYLVNYKPEIENLFWGPATMRALADDRPRAFWFRSRTPGSQS